MPYTFVSKGSSDMRYVRGTLELRDTISIANRFRR